MRRRRWMAMAALLGLLAGSGLAADLASVVPEDVFLFVEINNPEGIWADFEQSAVRDMIRAAPQGELQFRLAAGLVQQLALQKLGIRWGEFVSKFAGRFALVHVDVPMGERVEPCLLLDAAETKADLTALRRKTVEPAPRASTPGATFEDALHEDTTLRVIRAGGQTMAHAFLRDVLAIGAAEGVKKLISGQARRPLAASPAFAEARKRLAPAKGLVAYVNVRRLLEAARGQLEANPNVARQLDDLGLSGVQFAVFSSAFDGRGIRDRIHLRTGEQKLGLVRLLTSLSPGASGAAEVLPKSCPIVVAMAFKDGPELWRAFLRFLEGGGAIERMARLDADRDTLRLRFGIDFDHDFVGALGGEVFLAANPDATAEYAAKRQWPGRNDLPFIIGFRVADAEGLKTTIHRFITAQPVMGQGVERAVAHHRGVEINTLTLPGSKLHPSYAFVGGYLLVAKSKAIIQQCIDAKATGQSLSSVGRFRTFLKKMPAKYNAMVYVDLQTLAMAAVGQRAVPDAAKTVVQQLRGFYATLTAHEDGVTLETYSRYGLAGILGLAGLATSKTTVAPGPPPPKPAQF